jgi:hypothetical protein
MNAGPAELLGERYAFARESLSLSSSILFSFPIVVYVHATKSLATRGTVLKVYDDRGTKWESI